MSDIIFGESSYGMTLVHLKEMMYVYCESKKEKP